MKDAASSADVNAQHSESRTEGSSLLLGAGNKRWVKIALVTIGIVAVIAAAVFIYTNRPIAVQVAAIEHDVPVRVFGLGTVEARVLSKVGFEIGATLVELAADHGDRVAKGQVLARLGVGEQEAKVAKASAARLIAEVNIKRAEANLEKAQAVLAQTQEANKRKQSLAGRDIVSQQAAEEAARDEAVARADVTVAESEVTSAKAQLADAEAQLQFEETMLRHRTLVAPYDALVIERHSELGTVVKAGDPIFTLIADGAYWGLAHVDEARAGFLSEGQHVDARLRSRPQDEFTGSVARIGLESDRTTEERRVFIKGDNPPPRVYLGEQAEFWITVDQLKKALLVPEAAVSGYDGRQGAIWTVEDGRLEIVEGVPDQAQVVVRIGQGFREGRSVRVGEAGSP